MALPPHLAGDDLLKFRTRHCDRFMRQGKCRFADKCQYSHDALWTRRPLWRFNYSPQLCHNVILPDAQGGPSGKNAMHQFCPLHRQCPFAHCREEQIYHPRLYKKAPCKKYLNSNGRCDRYYCPFAHGFAELQGQQPPDNLALEILRSVPQDVLCPPNVYAAANEEHSLMSHRFIVSGTNLVSDYGLSLAPVQPLSLAALQNEGTVENHTPAYVDALSLTANAVVRSAAPLAQYFAALTNAEDVCRYKEFSDQNAENMTESKILRLDHKTAINSKSRDDPKCSPSDLECSVSTPRHGIPEPPFAELLTREHSSSQKNSVPSFHSTGKHNSSGSVKGLSVSPGPFDRSAFCEEYDQCNRHDRYERGKVEDDFKASVLSRQQTPTDATNSLPLRVFVEFVRATTFALVMLKGNPFSNESVALKSIPSSELEICVARNFTKVFVEQIRKFRGSGAPLANAKFFDIAAFVVDVKNYGVRPLEIVRSPAQTAPHCSSILRMAAGTLLSILFRDLRFYDALLDIDVALYTRNEEQRGSTLLAKLCEAYEWGTSPCEPRTKFADEPPKERTKSCPLRLQECTELIYASYMLKGNDNPLFNDVTKIILKCDYSTYTTVYDSSVAVTESDRSGLPKPRGNKFEEAESAEFFLQLLLTHPFFWTNASCLRTFVFFFCHVVFNEGENAAAVGRMFQSSNKDIFAATTSSCSNSKIAHFGSEMQQYSSITNSSAYSSAFSSTRPSVCSSAKIGYESDHQFENSETSKQQAETAWRSIRGLKRSKGLWNEQIVNSLAQQDGGGNSGLLSCDTTAALPSPISSSYRDDHIQPSDDVLHSTNITLQPAENAPDSGEVDKSTSENESNRLLTEILFSPRRSAFLDWSIKKCCTKIMQLLDFDLAPFFYLPTIFPEDEQVRWIAQAVRMHHHGISIDTAGLRVNDVRKLRSFVKSCWSSDEDGRLSQNGLHLVGCRSCENLDWEKMAKAIEEQSIAGAFALFAFTLFITEDKSPEFSTVLLCEAFTMLTGPFVEELLIAYWGLPNFMKVKDRTIC